MEYEVARKIEQNQEHDRRRLKDSRCMTIEEGIDLLKQAEYRCVVCNCELLLEGWEPYDERQFSFDRIDDTLPHIKDNLRVTCLACNVKKALEQYKPTEHLADYNLIKEEFFYICRNNIRDHEYKKRLTTAAYNLHQLTYGDRKKSNWRKHDVEPALPDPNYRSKWILRSY